MRAKWPRWLVPKVSSKPSSERCCGTHMIPALFTNRSSASVSSPSANCRTDARLPRSSSTTSTWAFGTSSRIWSAAAAPFCRLRQAISTVAPARASSRAVTSPSPLLAPVTTAVRPDWSGIWSVVQGDVM